MLVHGEGQLLVPAHLNFAKHILNKLKTAEPSAVCLKSYVTKEELTCSEFGQHAVSVAVALSRLGVARGDTVAVASEYRLAFLPTALGIMLTGATFTPISMQRERDVLEHKLKLTKPKYVICSRLFWESNGDWLKGLDFIRALISFNVMDDIELSVEAMVSGQSRHPDWRTFEPAVVSGDDVLLITYSSGTTSNCKGVEITHHSYLTRFAMAQRYYCKLECFQTAGLDQDFTSGFSLVFMLALVCAGKTVLFREDNEKWINILKDLQVGILFSYPNVIENMLRDGQKVNNLNSLKMLVFGGSPVQPRHVRAFSERYPHVQVAEVYGSAELFVVATTLNLAVSQDINVNIPPVGLAEPEVTIKVVDVKTRQVLGPNQRGEICVRTPAQMKGYLGAPTLGLDEQGFYPTGDLGYYDEQKRIYHLDRLTDVIWHLGYQVSPRDVESVLVRHAAVREAAVVEKAAGGGGGSELVGFVALRPGAAASELELLRFVAQQVASHMQLSGGVRFLPELPRNPRLKILRRQLKDMLARE